jgi:tRNA(fMet)-specific endonuclease VapC
LTEWYMIDTNTVSYIVKRKSNNARLQLAGLAGKQAACISAITEAEIRYGLAKRPVTEGVLAAIEGFLLKIRVLSWGREEARAYGDLRAALEASGKTLGNLDMLIAAHAIAIGAVLVTNDKAFCHVKNLPSTVNWATDL